MKGAKLANLGGRKAHDACAGALAKWPQSLGRERGGDGSMFGRQGKAAARTSFCTKRASLQWLFALMFALAGGMPSAFAEEWDCASTSGTFERSTDCTMGDEVSLSGNLSVTGNEYTYTTLTAASGKRHFSITNGAHLMRLTWLNLTGGDVSAYDSSPDDRGGSILIYNVAAHLNISHCVFFSNRAYGGGAVTAAHGQPTLFFFSVIFEYNIASFYGGGVYLYEGTFFDKNNIFSRNRAGDSGGAMYIWTGGTVISDNNTYNENLAEKEGGAMGIYDGAIVSSTDSSFVNTQQAMEEAPFTGVVLPLIQLTSS